METTINTIADNLTGENPEAPNVNIPLRYLTATSVIGDEVWNDAGEHLGEIKDVMLDVIDGHIHYCIVEFGGFLGIGEKFFAIPYRLLKVDPASRVYRFNESKERLKSAPGFDKEHWPDTNAHSNYVTDSWSFWN